MIHLFCKNKLIIFIVVSILIVGVYETRNPMNVNGRYNSSKFAIHSSDKIVEDADEFLEGTMDKLTLDGEQLTLDKESEDDFWKKMSNESFTPKQRSVFSYAYNSQNAKMICFGGIDPWSYPAGMAQTIVYDLKTKSWALMNPVPSPSVRHRTSMVYASNSDKVILYSGYNYASMLTDTWSYDLVTNNWTNMNPSANPGGRYLHSMAYDSNFDNLILFGGYGSGGIKSSTWAYNLTTNTWTNLNPVMFPSARKSHSMVYDTNSGKVILFGGDGSWTVSNLPLNDTWIYDPATNNWTNMNPVSKPNARIGHSMAYDEDSGKVILFGGYNGSFHFNDTWIYDLTTNNWTKMNPVTKPNARFFHGLVYSADINKTLLFGGSDNPDVYGAGYNSYRDTWTYDLTANDWTQVFSDTPAPSHSHSMAYGADSDQALLFGGYDGTYYDDTWVFNVTTNNWTNMNPLEKPSARYGHSLVYDIGSDKEILFGGYNGSYLSDTWVYNRTPNTWTQMNPPTTPGARFGHSMVYATSSGKVLLFGGYDGSNHRDETWIYDLAANNWTQIHPVMKPPKSSHHSMVYAANTNEVILFGGTNGTYFDNTWVFDLITNSWTQMYPAEKPSARSDHSMAYNPISKNLILFGGYNGSYFNDTWTYDLTANNWTHKILPISPNTRFDHSMVFLADRVVLFGGYDGKNLGDTWIYVENTYHQNGTFLSRLTNLKVTLVITGEFTWKPETQPTGTGLKFQLGLSNTTKDEDFQYSNYHTADFQFSGVASCLKYRIVFESDINQYSSPVLERINITFSFKVPSVPSAPQNLSAIPGEGFVELSWTPPITDSGSVVMRYHIYRGTTSGQYIFLGISTSTTFKDTTTIGGTTYYYVVTGINTIGESNVSNEVSALPAAFSTSETTTQLTTITQTTTKSESTIFPGVLTILVILSTLVVVTRKHNKK